jgi:hypothetical protein
MKIHETDKAKAVVAAGTAAKTPHVRFSTTTTPLVGVEDGRSSMMLRVELNRSETAVIELCKLGGPEPVKLCVEHFAGARSLARAITESERRDLTKCLSAFLQSAEIGPKDRANYVAFNTKLQAAAI